VSASFVIDYQNARRPVEQPERYEGYDLVSAHYDYLPSGPSATIIIGDYSLDLDGLIFVNWVRESLPLAERLAANAPDDQADLRRFLPGLPQDARVYFWIAADIPFHPPLLLFASLRDQVLIYTRASASVGGPQLICTEADREDPTTVPLSTVLSEISNLLTQYLDDLVGAFPFIEQDDVYQNQRSRIAAIKLAR
jgi:hypothetical protein